jgi:hypothetical protein
MGGGEESARSAAYEGGRVGKERTAKTGLGTISFLKSLKFFALNKRLKPLTSTTSCGIFVLTHNIM